MRFFIKSCVKFLSFRYIHRQIIKIFFPFKLLHSASTLLRAFSPFYTGNFPLAWRIQKLIIADNEKAVVTKEELERMNNGFKTTDIHFQM